MYIPKHFDMHDPGEVASFIHAHSFGVLISGVDGRPFATHLPFLYDAARNVLFAHMAKANPQWQDLDGQEVLVVFSGPHAYISPFWYEEAASVPTWNYVAVHVYGTCAVIDNEQELGAWLADSVRFYEPDSDVPAQADEPFYRNLMKAIVGFRIDITNVEGKAKLSQNKSVEAQERVVAKLSASADPSAQAIGQWMQDYRKGSKGVE